MAKVSAKKVKDFVKKRVAEKIAAGEKLGSIRKSVIAEAKAEFGEKAIDWATLIALILEIIKAFRQ